jgi:hypothetical protein
MRRVSRYAAIMQVVDRMHEGEVHRHVMNAAERVNPHRTMAGIGNHLRSKFGSAVALKRFEHIIVIRKEE